jgi:hypothetical protein
MNLRLLEVDELAGASRQQRDDDRQGLREAEPDVSNADHVSRAPLLRLLPQATHAQLDLGVVEACGFDLPGEAEFL